MRMLLTSALLLSLCCLCSCITVRSVRYSAPYVDDARVTRTTSPETGDMFVTDDAMFWISPANDVSHEMTLLPFPMRGYARSPHEPTFYVLIKIRPIKDDLQLDVTQIQFRRGSGEWVTPTFFAEPSMCRTTLREPWRLVPPTTVLLKRGDCSALWVEFDTRPPTPAALFSIRIGGIDRAEVLFHLSSRVESSALP